VSFSDEQALGWRDELIAARRTIQSQQHRIAELESGRRSAVLAERERQAAVTREHLRGHYLAGIECDRIRHQDRPSCACSLVDLGWHDSVGAAVDAWLEHALGGSS
jgi:hypothetical protein